MVRRQLQREGRRARLPAVKQDGSSVLATAGVTVMEICTADNKNRMPMLPCFPRASQQTVSKEKEYSVRRNSDFKCSESMFGSKDERGARLDLEQLKVLRDIYVYFAHQSLRLVCSHGIGLYCTPTCGQGKRRRALRSLQTAKERLFKIPAGSCSCKSNNASNDSF